MDLESIFPASARHELALQINNLLAAPSFAAWRDGEPLDIQRLLYTPEGRPRLSIVSIAHLTDSERMFFVTLLLNEVIAWMRAQPGTSSLRALLYMDEVFGYFPPTANPPSKTPMLTLLKQARAFGLGVVLATQNPVDLDYKGLSNAGTWFLGRLQTERDKARVLDGLEGASASAGTAFDRARLEKVLSALGSRVFLMNNVHEDAPVVFQTRWALSYLRGPLTRAQIETLMKARRTAEPVTGTAAPSAAGAAQAAPASPRGGPSFRRGSTSVSSGLRGPPGPCAARLPPGSLRNGACPLRPESRRHRSVGDDRTVEHRERRPAGPGLAASGRGGRLDSGRAGRVARRGEFRGTARSSGPPPELRNLEDRAEELRLRALSAEIVRVPIAEGDVPSRRKRRRFSRAAPATGRRVARRANGEAPAKVRTQTAAAGATPSPGRAADRAREIASARAALQTATSFGSTILGAIFGRKLRSATNVSRAATSVRSAGRVAREQADVARAEENAAALRQQSLDLDAEFQTEVASLRDKYAVEQLEIVETPVRAQIRSGRGAGGLGLGSLVRRFPGDRGTCRLTLSPPPGWTESPRLDQHARGAALPYST